MEKKQTAVEWLVDQIKSKQNQKNLSANDWMQVIEKAKDMESIQISDSWNDGNLAGRNGWVDLEYSTGKGYYIETYGK